MTVKIVKRKQEKLSEDKDMSKEAEIAAEQYGSLSKEISSLKKKMEKLDEERKEYKEVLEKYGESFNKEKKVAINAEKYDVTLGVVAKKVTKVDKDILLDVIGDDTWFELTCPGTTDIRKYCNPEQLETILTEKREGARRITIKKK